jgi:hypothetical protein
MATAPESSIRLLQSVRTALAKGDVDGALRVLDDAGVKPALTAVDVARIRLDAAKDAVVTAQAVYDAAVKAGVAVVKGAPT